MSEYHLTKPKPLSNISKVRKSPFSPSALDPYYLYCSEESIASLGACSYFTALHVMFYGI